MRDDQKKIDIVESELRSNLKMLAKNEEEILHASYKTKLRASTQVVAQMHNEAFSKYLNHKNMQQDYWFKRF